MTLETTKLAIVPPTDPRVVAYAEREPAARKLIDGFRDETGHPISPSVLISRSGRRISLDAVNAFRTAIAMSCVLRSRAAIVAGAAHTQPSWSDHFDTHPTEVTRQGRLTTYSPAVVGLRSPTAPFLAMPLPYVDHAVTSLFFDTYLYRCLGNEWKRLYGGRQREGATDPRAVFRALELAYLAAATPAKLGGVHNEWGISVALWVSGIEVLASAASEPHWGSTRTVHALLGEFKWSPSGRGPWDALDRLSYSVRLKKIDVRANAVQHAYQLMYKARSAYLHGDRLIPSLLRPWRRRGAPTLQAFAPVVFRSALAAYLQREYSLKREPDDVEGAVDYFNSLIYREAIGATYGLRPRNRTNAE